MPKTLKCKILQAAEADHRNMAQWCVVQLEKALQELGFMDSKPDKK